MPPMPHDVFLSYASTDRPAADAICAALEARGIRCWIAPRDVPAGADWGEAILTAIGRAHAMVLVLSACGKKDANPPLSATDATPTETPATLTPEPVAPPRALVSLVVVLPAVMASERTPVALAR